MRARLVRAIWQHPRRVLALALVVVLAAGALASRLALRSNLADLLQSDDPAAREIHRIADRLPSTLMMVIAIEGPDRAANRRAASALARRLDALRPALVDTAIGDLHAERAFFDAHRWLYADLATLTQIRDALRTAIARAKNPLLIEIDDEDAPRAQIERLTRRMAQTLSGDIDERAGAGDGDGSSRGSPAPRRDIDERADAGRGDGSGRGSTAPRGDLDEREGVGGGDGSSRGATTPRGELDERDGAGSGDGSSRGSTAPRGALDEHEGTAVAESADGAGAPRGPDERERTRSLRGLARFRDGYFETDEGRLVIALVRPARGSLGEDVGRELRDATLAAIDELRAAGAIAASSRVELGGNMIVQLEERSALMRDLARASLACLVLVAVVVVAFFGRLRVVGLFGVPAVIGVTVGYGMAAVVWGFVNLSAAFMATIIVGNGINFAIIQQARYDEERQRGATALEAAIAAVRTTSGATLVAALGAAAAYGSLTLTRFRGFSQFGAIGATGMIAAWLATLIVLPALWAVLDAGPARRRFRSLAQARWLGWFGRRPRLVLVIGGVAAALSIARLPGYLGDPFEYDLTRLRNRTGAAAGVGARAERVFGETVAPLVVLAERRDDVPEIQRRLRERAATPEGVRLLSAIRTIDDLVPADQAAKLAVLGELRALIDEAGPDGELAKLRPPDALGAIAIADLPRSVRGLFTEVDGTVGRIVLIYDHPRLTAYDGRAQLALAALIGEVPLDRGAVARAPVLFAGLLRGIVHDAPIATGLSLLGVIALVALFDRTRRGVALVIGALVLGVVWMVGAAAWLGVRVNFLNFIALPITLGIGVDYGINMYRRCTLEGPGGIGRAVRAVGGALVLCSSTTVIGYGSLLLADNQALRSFGAMAILGEVATLLAAVTMLPAALLVLRAPVAPPPAG